MPFRWECGMIGTLFEMKPEGAMFMSYADQVFIQTCKDILSKGVWDTDREVRPRW